MKLTIEDIGEVRIIDGWDRPILSCSSKRLTIVADTNSFEVNVNRGVRIGHDPVSDMSIEISDGIWNKLFPEPNTVLMIPYRDSNMTTLPLSGG
jgi:hypothetical protein